MRAPSSLANLVAVFLPLVCSAEPTRTPQWLMNEPMSLFDWGIYQAEKKMGEMKITSSIFTAEYFSTSARYDWDSNRIELGIMLVGKGTEAECSENLKKAKAAFLSYTWDEKEHSKVASEVMQQLFSHNGGYATKGRPADLGSELASITTIEATILVRQQSGSFAPKARCRSGLKSPEISIIRQ